MQPLSQPVPRPSAQTQRPSPSFVLLRCSPFPEGWVGPETENGQQRVRTGSSPPRRRNSGDGQLLLAPPPPPSLAQPCPCPSSQLLLEPQRASPGRQEDEGAQAPGGALLRPLTHHPERGAGKQRHRLAEAAAMREQEQPDRRMRGAAQVLPGGNRPPAHPLSSRVSATRSQPGRAWGASPAGPPEGTLEPESRRARMRHWPGAHTGQGSA